MIFNLNKLKFFFIFFFLFFNNCSNKDPDLVKKRPPAISLEILYKQGYNLFLDGNYSESKKIFNKIETQYSYSPWAGRATLMILYMNYDLGKLEETIQYINKFKKLYPTDKNISYVDYISALILYEKVSPSSKDQTNTELALKKFKSIIKKYPGSQYAEDSKLKIDLLNENMAGNEMYIARYYMKRSKWTAAIIRLKNILDNYPNTIYVIEAYHRLVEIYYNLGNIQEAKKYAAILGYNFNTNEWYKKSYRLIKDKNFQEIEKKEIEKDKVKLKDRLKKILNILNFQR